MESAKLQFLHHASLHKKGIDEIQQKVYNSVCTFMYKITNETIL